MSKIQILKAIHNTGDMKGITREVVSDVKDTNFESYSQRRAVRFPIVAVLFQMSKIQILKAIHNPNYSNYNYWIVVSDVKDTNFESYSQRQRVCLWKPRGCFRCQRYKFWKLFTTINTLSNACFPLFQMSKIQILKAIHNETYPICF